MLRASLSKFGLFGRNVSPRILVARRERPLNRVSHMESHSICKRICLGIEIL